jgi:response regulator RpfG family c-di-GMP phosphodiesterase
MSKPTLILVDDEERILRSLRMLFFTGYNVQMTPNAHEALDILRKEKVHVIVSDQRMPIMLGAELLRNAREISPATMRILLTGYSDLEASIACVNDGEVFRYLMKPWDGDEMRRVVAEAATIAEASFAIKSEILLKSAQKSTHKIRVLVMDNDPFTAQIVTEILWQRAEVMWAKNIEHAVELLAQNDIAIMVSELMLDGNNIGYFLKTIKQYNPSTQSIVVTSFSDSARLIELINQAQIARFLPKPLRKQLLERNLNYLIERFNEMCALPVLQNRQIVAPIIDNKEKSQSAGLMSFLRKFKRPPISAASF